MNMFVAIIMEAYDAVREEEEKVCACMCIHVCVKSFHDNCRSEEEEMLCAGMCIRVCMYVRMEAYDAVREEEEKVCACVHTCVCEIIAYMCV